MLKIMISFIKPSKDKDLVFHLAAKNIIASMENPLNDALSNILGSLNLFQACSHFQTKRILYSSTSSVYGNALKLPLKEEDSLEFLNCYSVSKYAAEAYAEFYQKVKQLPITVVRYSNVYGYNQTIENPYSGVIGKFIGFSLQNEPITIFSDGQQTRDFTFIDDACRATILSATKSTALGKIYNIGTGVETSINSLAETILQKTSSISGIQRKEGRDIDNVRRRSLDIAKIRNDLSWSPIDDLNSGIEKTIDWTKKNYFNSKINSSPLKEIRP